MVRFSSKIRRGADKRFEEMAEDGELSRDGQPGGGLETIYAGGMHNLAIDEAGKVPSSSHDSIGANDRSVLGE